MTETPAPEAWSFDTWLADARVAQTAVEIIQRPDLIAEYKEWRARYDTALQAKPGDGERAMGEPDPLSDLVSEGRRIIEQLEAGRSWWFIAALGREDETAIEDAYPLPEPPVTFERAMPNYPNNPTDAQAQAFVDACTVWEQARAKFQEDNAGVLEPWLREHTQALLNRNAERVARAVVSIKQDGVTRRVRLTVEQVHAATKAMGETQFLKLVQALTDTSTVAPEVPAYPLFMS